MYCVTQQRTNSESGAHVPHEDAPSSHPDRRPNQQLSLGSPTCNSHTEKSSRNKTFSIAKMETAAESIGIFLLH